MVHDNPEKSRFELEHDGQIAFSVYRREPGVITIIHTEVPPEFQGKGIGSALARGLLDLIRQSGERLVARCPFIAAYVRKHQEYQDLERR